ncbi:hypothetical protein V6N12_047244 [Hibiscus sabdariffa]|uniref:Uncharacterized protein n=1 Tax=Hibiscus sabdariffa TaxID=183260 RepID=A0ABR2DAP2_9ROSI
MAPKSNIVKKRHHTGTSSAHFDLVNNEWIPRSPQVAPAPPAARQPVAPVLEGDVSLGSLLELITQMEDCIMCYFDSFDEHLDIFEYSVELFQDDDKDDVDGGDDAPET